MDVETRLIETFLSMKRALVLQAVGQAIDEGEDALRILAACRRAMERVGERFESGEFFLSELIYAAEVFKGISALLEPVLASRPAAQASGGRVVFGTPRGDIHDLGKNIVITMMRAHGFDVRDLGVNVEPESFIVELQRTAAPILALSALITPAFPAMQETIDLLVREGLRDKTFVIIGGGVTNELARREVGADAQTLDPTAAIRLCRAYMKERGNPA